MAWRIVMGSCLQRSDQNSTAPLPEHMVAATRQDAVPPEIRCSTVLGSFISLRDPNMKKNSVHEPILFLGLKEGKKRKSPVSGSWEP